LWADSVKLIAGCAKLLTSPGKLNIREHSVGALASGGCSRSMNAKRTAEQLFRVYALGFTVPLQASLHLSVGAFFTCGFSLTFQRSCPEPAVQPSRRLQKLNNSKSKNSGRAIPGKYCGNNTAPNLWFALYRLEEGEAAPFILDTGYSGAEDFIKDYLSHHPGGDAGT